MHVDNSEVVLVLKDRVLKTTLTEISLYQGRGNGVVTVDGTGKEALVAADFSLSDIAAQQLLKDFRRHRLDLRQVQRKPFDQGPRRQ